MRTRYLRDLKRGMVVIDEKKVALMTKLAVYEKHENRRKLVMSRYYETDYVRYNVLKTWVAATVAYWLIIAVYVFMSFDDLLAKVNDVDYFDLMYKVLGTYAVFCVVYYLISSVVYRYRYIKAKPGLVEYNSNLRDLIELSGGPMHKGKVAKNSRVNEIQNLSEKDKSNGDMEKNRATQSKNRVNRSEIVKKREAEEEKRRQAEIIENVKKRNERLAVQNEEKLRQQREAEEDRRRIQERRKQLEREQMEKIRNERLQNMQRQNHMYNNTGNNEGSNR